MSEASPKTYIVTTTLQGVGGGPIEKTVEAAYYVHDQGFTIFKGTDGEIVMSVSNEHIAIIERSDSTS